MLNVLQYLLNVTMVCSYRLESFENVITKVLKSFERVLGIIEINEDFNFFFERKQLGLKFLLHHEDLVSKIHI